MSSKLLLEVDVYNHRGTETSAALLHRLTEKHNVSETEFLVDAGGYLTALARQKLSGHLNYPDRNHIKKCFQTMTVRVDRFTRFCGAVNRARNGSCASSDTTTTAVNRTRHYTATRLRRRC
jgi:transposase-like protein